MKRSSFIYMFVAGVFICILPDGKAIEAADFEFIAKPIRLSADNDSKLIVAVRLTYRADIPKTIAPSIAYVADPLPLNWIRKPVSSSHLGSVAIKSYTLKKGVFISDSIELKNRFSSFTAGSHSLHISITLVDEASQGVITLMTTCQIEVLASDL